jgi:hypothetical protein
MAPYRLTGPGEVQCAFEHRRGVEVLVEGLEVR